MVHKYIQYLQYWV